MPTYSDDEDKRQQPTFSRPPVATTMSAEEFGKADPAPSQPTTMSAEEFGATPAAETETMSAEQFGKMPVERNIVGDVASNLARGVADTAELAGYALKTAGAETVGDWIVDKTEDANKDVDFLQADQSEMEGEGAVKRGVMGGMRSIVPSVSSAAIGAAGGAVVGSAVPVVGTLVGGLVGAGLGALGLFGVGIYGKEKQAALDKGLSEEEAHIHGLEQGVVEGGIEMLATPLELLTSGIGRGLTTPLKQTIKELVRTPAKKLLRNYLQTMGTETATEMLQGGLGTKLAQTHGMGEGTVEENVLESIIPALTMSLIFGVGGHAYTAKQQHTMRKALADGEYDPEVRAGTANTIYNEIAKDDAELAKVWYEKAQDAITNYQPIDIDVDFAEFANQRTKAEKEGGITADNLPNPEDVADFDVEEGPAETAPENPSSGTISRMVDKAPVVPEEAPVVPESEQKVSDTEPSVSDTEQNVSSDDPLAAGKAAAQSVDASLDYQGMDSMGLHHFRNPQGESFAAESIDPVDIKARWEKSQEGFRNDKANQVEYGAGGNMAGGQDTAAVSVSPQEPGTQSADEVPGQPDGKKPESPVAVRTAGEVKGEKVTPGAKEAAGGTLSGEFDPLKIIQEGTGQETAVEEKISNPKSQRRVARLRENIKALEADIKDWSSRVYTKTDMGYEKKDMYGQESGTDSYTNANERRRKRTIKGFEQSIAEQQAEIDKIVKEEGVQADAVGYEPIMAETDTGTFRTKKQAQAAIDQVGQTENYEVVSAKGHNVGPSGFVGMPKYSKTPAVGNKKTNNINDIQKAFPGQKVVKGKDGVITVRTTGGRTITVHPDTSITTEQGEKAAGSFQQIGKDGIIQLAKFSGSGTLKHEIYHAAEAMVLTRTEITALQKKYGNEEKRAEAYAEWNGSTRETLFEKIKDFFKQIANILGGNFDRNEVVSEKAFKALYSGKAWDRKGIQERNQIKIGDIVIGVLEGDKKYNLDAQKWTEAPQHLDVFGTVNNRLSKELEVIENLLGPIDTAQYYPGKMDEKGIRQDARTIKARDLGVALFEARDDGRLGRLVDPKIKVSKLADERGLKGKERKKFITEVNELRSGPLLTEIDSKGKPVLSNNGKAGQSVDLILGTCQPTGPCQECYAAASMIRMSAVRKAFRNTVHMLVDPIDFGTRIANEAKKVHRSKLPFIRLLGSGDLTTDEAVDAFNQLAKLADRPIHIFSRHHDNLARLKGTKDAPFIKMGSLDSDLVAYYGTPFLKENLSKRGINNAFLNRAYSDKVIVDDLVEADAVGLILSVGEDLHNFLGPQAKTRSCPCDAEERSYMGSCRQCALNNGGCYTAFADKVVDTNGKIWTMGEDGMPKNVMPVLSFLNGKTPEQSATTADAFSEIANDIVKKSIDLINLYRRKFLTDEERLLEHKNQERAKFKKFAQLEKERKAKFTAAEAKRKANAEKKGKPFTAKEFKPKAKPKEKAPPKPSTDQRGVAVTIKDLRWPEDAVTMVDKDLFLEREKEKGRNITEADLVNTESRIYMDRSGVIASVDQEINRLRGIMERITGEKTFYLPGGEIQKPVAYYKGMKLGAPELISKEDAKTDNYGFKDDISESPDSTLAGTGGAMEVTLGEILDDAAANAPNRLTKTLAKLLQGFIKGSKLDIMVLIDPSVTSPNYHPGLNTITINNMDDYVTSVHEIVHAVTVHEMEANPALKARVTRLMNRVGRSAVADGLFTEEELAKIREARTSKGFKEAFMAEGKFSGKENIAYAFVNEKEFLAQAFSSISFQQLLERTKVRDKGALKSGWDAFLEMVMKGLGLKLNHKNSFSEAIKLVAELSQVQVDGATQISTIEQGDISLSISAKQAISSADTSLNQVAAIFKRAKIKGQEMWKKGTVNFDLGGGKFDTGTKYLAGLGVENLVYDPFNRSEEHNAKIAERVKKNPPDTVTVNNVLNVIKESGIRAEVIKQASATVKPDGTVYFMIHQGDGNGKSRVTKMKDGVAKNWQNHQKTDWYMKEVEKYFGDVSKVSNIIIAKNPALKPEAGTNTAFDKWFGDSKVVDENGAPLVVYHGSSANIGDDFVFDYSFIGQQGRNEGAGFYFTTNKRIASGYGEKGGIASVYLSIKKPMPYSQKAFPKNKIRKILATAAKLEAKEWDQHIGDGFLSNYGDVRYDGLDRVLSSAADLMAAEESAIEQLGGLIGSGVETKIVNTAVYEVTGFDGIKANGFSDLGSVDSDLKQDIYVAFFPNQIKSVDNKGSFDESDQRIKFSTTEDTGPKGNLEQEIEKTLGKRGLRNLIKNGTVNILDSQEQAMKLVGESNKSVRYSKYGKIQGFVSGRKVYLVRDGINKGQAFPVLKHELGVHLRKLAATDKEFTAIKDMLKSRQKERGRTGKAIRAAMARVPKGTAQNVYWEEVLAYMVEMHPDHSLVKRVIARVKELLENLGIRINTLTVDDLNDLAIAAVRQEARGEKRSQTLKSAVAPMWTSRLSEIVATKGPKAAAPEQWLKSIESWKKKGTMPVAVQEELEWSGLEEYLEDFEGAKITKAEIDSFLASNKVEVNEVTLSGGNEYEGDWADASSEEVLAAYMEMTGQTEDEVQWVTEGDMIVELNMNDTLDGVSEKGNSGTKHDTYQLPGGENYKEMLITLPVKHKKPEVIKDGYAVTDQDGYIDSHHDTWIEARDAAKESGGYWNPTSRKAEQAYEESRNTNVYNSGHFDEPNILTHIRFNERTDSQGNKVLFLEEVQSDWHQEGREKNYKRQYKKLPKEFSVVPDDEYPDRGTWVVKDKDGEVVTAGMHKTKESAIREQLDWLNDRQGEMPPDAPFKKSWPLLAMKRMIRYAAENGFDRIAWTTGQQQFNRYSSGTEEQQAKRLKGMTAFYEKMLPSQVDKFIKKFGAKTSLIPFEIEEYDRGFVSGSDVMFHMGIPEERHREFWADAVETGASESFMEAYRSKDNNNGNQPGFEITDEMKASVLGQGMPLFSIAPTPGMSRIKALAKKFLSEEQLDKTISYLFDKDHVIKRVQGEIGPQAENKDYNLIRRLLGKKISDETVRFEQDRLKPLIEEIAAGKINFDNVDELAWAEHAPERNLQMKRVNARRYIDNFMSFMTGKEKEPFLDQLMDIQSEFVMNRQTRNDRRDNYIKLMDSFASDVLASEAAVRKEIDDAQQALDTRIFTAAETLKGTPARAQKKIDNMTKRLDARLAIGERWEDVKDRLSGLTNDEAQDIMDKWTADSRYPAIRSAVDKLRKIGADALEMNYLAGELTDEEYDAIKNTYSKHVPLYREDMDEGGKTSTGRLGHGPLSKPIKIAAGSTKKAVDIFAHVIDRYQSAIGRKHKLAADKILYDMVNGTPDADRWSITTPEKKPYLDDQGNIRYYDDNFTEKKNQIKIKVDGVPRLLEVPQDNKSMRRWMDALKREPVEMGPMLKASGKITRFLAMLNTSFSPEFIITNFGRDIQTAGVNMEDSAAKGMQKKVFKNVKNAIQGIYRQERGKPAGDWGKWYLDFAEHGAKIGWMQGYENVEELAENLEKELEYAEGKRPVRAKFRKLGDFIGAMNTAVENGVRLATYRALVESGVSKSKAAHTAANLTVDFTRSGTINPAMNSLYMFANAGIQGNVRMLKALRNKKVQKIAGGIFAFGMTAGLIGAFMGGDDEDGEPYYDKLKRTNPDLFERNMIFMIPGTKGRYIKIPMPYGYNVLYVAGNEASDMMRGKNPLEAMSHVGSAMMNTFNPIGSATLLQTIMPTVGDPIAQVFENKSWSGQDLMPGANPFGIPVPDSERYWKSVNPIAKWATQAINKLTGGSKYEPGLIDVSPETVEMMIETYTGSLGRFLKDTASIPATLIIDGELPINKIPFARKLTGQMSEYVDSQIFRENSQKIDIFTKKYKEATPSQLAIMKTQPEAKMMGYTKAMDAQLLKMKKAKNFYEEKGEQEKADAMTERMNEQYIKYNTRFNKLMK